MDIEKVLKRVNDFLPPMPAVKFSVVKEKTGLFDSKIGGTPYFPKDMEYPRGKKKCVRGTAAYFACTVEF